MSACLKIGNIELTGEQIVSALARYKLLDAFLGNVLLDSMLDSIPLNEEEVFYALTGLPPNQKPDNFQSFLATWLEERQLPEAYIHWRICRELKLEKLKRAKFDKQVESEFLRRKSEFDMVEFSLIQTRNGTLAQELFFQIRDGESTFADLATKFSEGTERKTRGVVGPIKLSALPDSVSQLLRQKKPKTVLDPMKIGERFWVVRVENFCEARLTDDVCAEIRESLFSNWLKTSVQRMMEDPDKVLMIGGATAKTPPMLTS